VGIGVYGELALSEIVARINGQGFPNNNVEAKQE